VRSLHVLVGGPPASGKSTLAPALARELGLPLLAKDTVYGHFDTVRTSEELFGPETTEPLAGPWPLAEVDTTRQVDVGALARLVRDVPLGTAGRFTVGW
jgi:cytidylate kinase